MIFDSKIEDSKIEDSKIEGSTIVDSWRLLPESTGQKCLS